MYPLTFLSSFVTQQLVSCLLSCPDSQFTWPVNPLCTFYILLSLAGFQYIYLVHTSTRLVSRRTKYRRTSLGRVAVQTSGYRLTSCPDPPIKFCCVDLIGLHRNSICYNDFYSPFANRQSSSSRPIDFARCTRANTIYSTRTNLENSTGRTQGSYNTFGSPTVCTLWYLPRTCNTHRCSI